MDVVQGEKAQMVITLETEGSFALPITNIDIHLSDSADNPNTATIADGDITRTLEDASLLVLEFTVPAAETTNFESGIVGIEVDVDDRKAQILDAFNILESIE